jgi:N-terminal domain of anti-restriction factor ArdC
MHAYGIVTERILQKLEQGIVPWHQPWKQGIPRNLVTRTPYRGVNVFLAAVEVQSGHRLPRRARAAFLPLTASVVPYTMRETLRPRCETPQRRLNKHISVQSPGAFDTCRVLQPGLFEPLLCYYCA